MTRRTVKAPIVYEGGCSIKPQRVLYVLAVLQALLGARVLLRFVRGARGQRIGPAERPASSPSADQQVSIIVPVLNEIGRLAPCLEGLLAQGDEVREIAVVDGGSVDGTPALVAGYAARDPRVRLIDASPVPADWNGKAWGLHVGQQQTAPDTGWVLTIDADVRPTAPLVRSLLAHAEKEDLEVLSVATLQEVSGPGEALVHPSMLTTLVYRFGLPGSATRRVGAVQANGQCLLVRRQALARCGGFERVRTSRCEDVTLARCLVAAGHAAGFYEAGALVSARMYESGRETWQSWPRSLPLRDRYTRFSSLAGLVEVTLVQALPLPLLVTLRLLHGRQRVIFLVNVVLAMTRLGVLGGTRRAYLRPPWTYWLSPLCDLPVAIVLWASVLRRSHTWRGRALVADATSVQLG